MDLFEKLKEKSEGITTKDDVIASIKKYFHDVDFEYDFDEEDSVFITGCMGDDLPIHIGIYVLNEVLTFRCPLDLTAKSENCSEVLKKLNEINSTLIFGMFFLDNDSGNIVFEYGFPFREAKFSMDFFLSFLKMIIKIIDKYDGALKEIAEKAYADTYWSMYR